MRQPPEVLVGEKLRFSSCAREYLLRTQHAPSVGETANDTVVGYSRIIRKDIGFAAPVGHQVDDELDGGSRPADDPLIDKNLRIEGDA